jgi:Ca2+/Na+ antiporter
MPKYELLGLIIKLVIYVIAFITSYLMFKLNMWLGVMVTLAFVLLLLRSFFGEEPEED